MSLTWGDWLRFIVTPLVIAAFTAIVATRNSKKTPHERLKNLVDIHKNMPERFDLEKVVEGAIARELVDFDRRLAADQRGIWAGAKERLAQLRGETLATVIGAIACVAGLAIGLAEADSWPVAAYTVALAAGTGIALFTTVRVTSKDERASLNRDRAVAEIKAHFPRVLMQEVSEVGEFSISSGDYRLKLAERLADMGIFEKVIVPRESVDEEQLFSFVLTPEGKQLWDSALADVERQHSARLGHFDEDGDDTPGRGAPGA